MTNQRIAITGIGVVSALGIGWEPFWNALEAGFDGISTLSLFDTSELSCHKAGQVIGFDPEPLLGRKGLKYLDRSTQLLEYATGLALADRALSTEQADDRDIGLVVGTAFGSLESISGFDCEALRNGASAVNPMAFPNTVINSPAGHTAIRYGLTGLNVTISGGNVSSLHALRYAADCVSMGRQDIVLAGGVEELCLPLYGGCSRLNILSGSAAGAVERSAPFDVSRNGMILGEGAAIFVLESMDRAAAAGTRVYAEIAGHGESIRSSGRPDPSDPSPICAMRSALAHAELEPKCIDYVCASANGSVADDAIEAKAIKAVFGERSAELPIHAIKSACGECMGASGALQTASAILALQRGTIPATLNFQECDGDWGFSGLRSHAERRDVNSTIINCLGCDGNSASMILKTPYFSLKKE